MNRMGITNSVHPHHLIDGQAVEHYEIGIIKNKNTDIYFDDFPNNFHDFDNMLTASPYALLPKATSPTRLLLLSKMIDESVWKNDFYQPVMEILEGANNKRQELYGHLIMNPYFPWHNHPNHLVSSSYYRLIRSFGQAPACGGCLMFLGSVFIGFPLFLASLLLSLLYYVMDVVCCRLQLCRGSEKEKKFIEMVLKQHPELDTKKIDEEIKERISGLAKELMGKHTQLKIGIRIAQEEIVDEKNSDFYMQDSFLITIEKPSSVKTEDASDLV